MLFGFLNVSLAATLVHLGAPETDIVALLGDADRQAITASQDTLFWRDYRVAPSDIDAMRRSVFTSFGSCSIQEPIEELAAMGLV